MKNYMPLLLGLTFMSAYASDRPKTSLKLLRIKVYKLSSNILQSDFDINKLLDDPDNFEFVQITMNPLTATLWDLQEQLRQKVGFGNLVIPPHTPLDEALKSDPNLLLRTISEHLSMRNESNTNNSLSFWPLIHEFE